jgi:hypothetical protein
VIVVVVHDDGARTRESGEKHVEAIANHLCGSVIRQAELIRDDPVVRRAKAQRESSRARDLGGQCLLRQDERMAGLDRDDGCSDFDPFGDLPEKRDSRHRIEIAGHLRKPERRETLGLGGLSVVEQAGQSFCACAFLVRADHQADSHGDLLWHIAVPLVRHHGVKRSG